MTYSKSFPTKSQKSVYPNWKEIQLTTEEEKEVELEVRKHNLNLMAECINDAKLITRKSNINFDYSQITDIGIALFEKRASHEIFWKEKKAKEKFDSENEE